MNDIVKNKIESSEQQIYTVNVYNTITEQYENISVTEEFYREYMRMQWKMKNDNMRFYAHEIQLSGLIGAKTGIMKIFMSSFRRKRLKILSYVPISYISCRICLIN